MPIDVTAAGKPWRLRPTTDWAVIANSIARDAFEVATDRFYVNVVTR
jgi:hypothetical protein